MIDDPRYADLNNAHYPPCSRIEAKRAIDKILKRLGRILNDYPAQQRAARAPYATPRRCWISLKPTNGPHKGWGRLIHDAGHIIFRARAPNSRAHEHGHERVEREVLIFCQQQGWLDGKLKPVVVKPTTEEKRAKRLREIEAGLKRWGTKQLRAANAMKKLRREQARLRRLVTVVTVGPGTTRSES